MQEKRNVDECKKTRTEAAALAIANGATDDQPTDLPEY